MKNDFMTLPQKGLDKINSLSDLFRNKKREVEYQKIANSYWKSCENSYIGSEELYIKQEKALIKLFIPKISEVDQVLDIGCSNGRFTFLVSKHCQTVDAFDLSPNLINSARDQAEKDGIENINFNVKDIRNLKTEKIYDHIMCMGVFTAIPDEKIVKEAVSKIPKIIKKNGYLVLKDSLASSDSQIYVNADYAASYRNEEKYISMFENIGMRLEIEEVLHTSYMFNQDISSKFLLFKNVK